MSDMEAVKITLAHIHPTRKQKHLDKIAELGDDEYEVYNYCEANSIKVVNGEVYHSTTEELDPCGFVTKTVEEGSGYIEVVALYYNGGCSLEEILEEALNDN